MMYAARWGQVETIKEMLHLGADISRAAVRLAWCQAAAVSRM